MQPNNATLSDVRQVRPRQSDNKAVSEPCASNPSCMIDSVEIGCPRGMNGNVLNINVCSMTPVNTSVPSTGGQILPVLSLPTSSSQHKAL